MPNSDICKKNNSLKNNDRKNRVDRYITWLCAAWHFNDEHSQCHLWRISVQMFMTLLTESCNVFINTCHCRSEVYGNFFNVIWYDALCKSAMAKKKRPMLLFYIRNFWLLIIGWIHSYYLWNGDVLFIYILFLFVIFL